MIQLEKRRDYTQTDVPTKNLEWIKSLRYGIPELTVKGNVWRPILASYKWTVIHAAILLSKLTSCSSL